MNGMVLAGPVADDPAPLGDFFADGIGRKQGIVLGAAAVYGIAFLLPVGAAGGICVRSFQGCQWLVWIPSFWPFILPWIYPWFANVLFWLGLRSGLHSRWRKAGFWGALAAGLAAMELALNFDDWIASPSYLTWLGSMLMLATLCFTSDARLDDATPLRRSRRRPRLASAPDSRVGDGPETQSPSRSAGDR